MFRSMQMLHEVTDGVLAVSHANVIDTQDSLLFALATASPDSHQSQEAGLA